MSGWRGNQCDGSGAYFAASAPARVASTNLDVFNSVRTRSPACRKSDRASSPCARVVASVSSRSRLRSMPCTVANTRRRHLNGYRVVAGVVSAKSRIRFPKDLTDQDRQTYYTLRDQSVSKLAVFVRKSLEAPPGFEPGMEVLQTSALPLGDGAGRTSCFGAGESGRVLAGATTARARAGEGHHVWCVSRFRSRAKDGLPSVASHSTHAKRRMERETGFEPATSTLARSHSTTELFPPATKPKRNTRDLGPATDPAEAGNRAITHQPCSAKSA